MKIGFDFDQTLNTTKGMMTAKLKKKMGDDLYIISARNEISDSMKKVAEEIGIPLKNVFAVSSNKQKIEKVKELNLAYFYDNNIQVIEVLQSQGIKAILFQ